MTCAPICLQKYLHHFQSGSARIILADFDHFDVQTLLKESKLLVTDYSSVFFDFAYMQKASIYYQFDSADFHGKHYQKGYFNYREMGFGPVVETEDLLIKCIIENAKESFKIDDIFPENNLSASDSLST